MGTIRKEFRLGAAPAAVWDALRDFGALHTRLVRGFVTDTKLEEGGAVRLVRFANGVEVREHLVSADESERRLVYAVLGSPRFSHYSAAVQVFADGEGSRFVWTVDFLPNEMAPLQEAAMNAGVEAIRETLG